MKLWTRVTTKSLFAPLVLSHSRKDGRGCFKFWQLYFHCYICTRCHQAVTAFVEVSFPHQISLFESFQWFQASYLPQLPEAPHFGLEGLTSSCLLLLKMLPWFLFCFVLLENLSVSDRTYPAMSYDSLCMSCDLTMRLCMLCTSVFNNLYVWILDTGWIDRASFIEYSRGFADCLCEMVLVFSAGVRCLFKWYKSLFWTVCKPNLVNTDSLLILFKTLGPRIPWILNQNTLY